MKCKGKDREEGGRDCSNKSTYQDMPNIAGDQQKLEELKDSDLQQLERILLVSSHPAYGIVAVLRN